MNLPRPQPLRPNSLLSSLPLSFLAVLAVLACGCDKRPTGTADLQILSISDWHGQLDPLTERDASGKISSTYGGLGLLSTYFQADRAEVPHTLTVTAGDSIGATPPLSNFFEDRPAVEGLGFLGLQFNTFGNHDFDRGVEALRSRIDEAPYTFVSTNLSNVTAELGEKVATPYTLVELGDGQKVTVALLGLTNDDAPALQFPGRFGAIEVGDPVSRANKAAAEARARGAAVVVALVHMGATGTDDNGEPAGPGVDFARGLRGVDVVIADHTDRIVNLDLGHTLLVENRSKGRTYARVAVQVVDGKVLARSATIVEPLGTSTHALPSGQSCPATACPDGFSCAAGKCEKTAATADPAAEALLKPYREQIAVNYDVKIAKADGVFARDGNVERTRQVPLGDLVADALLEEFEHHGAQVVIVNSGGLRAPLPSSYAPKAPGLVRTLCSAAAPCDLVVGDVYALLPFNNTAVVRQVSGQVLWSALEHSVARIPNPDGRFLQIAGFRFSYQKTAPPGSRVRQVVLLDGSPQGKEIPRDDPTLYTLVTSDFTNAGGDDYAMLVEPNATAGREVLADVVLSYVRAKAAAGPLSPASYPANRINELP